MPQLGEIKEKGKHSYSSEWTRRVLPAPGSFALECSLALTPEEQSQLLPGDLASVVASQLPAAWGTLVVLRKMARKVVWA